VCQLPKEPLGRTDVLLASRNGIRFLILGSSVLTMVVGVELSCAGERGAAALGGDGMSRRPHCGVGSFGASKSPARENAMGSPGQGRAAR